MTALPSRNKMLRADDAPSSHLLVTGVPAGPRRCQARSSDDCCSARCHAQQGEPPGAEGMNSTRMMAFLCRDSRDQGRRCAAQFPAVPHLEAAVCRTYTSRPASVLVPCANDTLAQRSMQVADHISRGLCCSVAEAATRQALAAPAADLGHVPQAQDHALHCSICGLS